MDAYWKKNGRAFGRWSTGETHARLMVGRIVRPTSMTVGEAKELVSRVESIGDGLTLVIATDTSDSGPPESEPLGPRELVIGVHVAAASANAREPTLVTKSMIDRAAAAFTALEAAVDAADLPAALADAWSDATTALLLLPTGPNPYAWLVQGSVGRESDGGEGEFCVGSDMHQNVHDRGVWGSIVEQTEFDVCELDPATLPEETYLIAAYD
jgi:hypothetical protein